MKAVHAVAVTLLFALFAGAGAQSGLAQQQTPPDALKQPRAEVSCKVFEPQLEAWSVPTWDALDIVPAVQADRSKLAEAELERRGGARLIFEVDATQLLKRMLEQGREDLRRVVREARLGPPSVVTVQGGTVEIDLSRMRDRAALLNAISASLSSPFSPLVNRGPDARGFVTFVVSNRTFEERRKTSEQAAIDLLELLLAELGLGASSVQSLGDGRILVIAPGLMQPERLTQLARRSASLTFRIADRSANPCAVPTAPDGGPQALEHRATKSSLLVDRHVIVSGEDIVAVAVVRDPRSGTPAVSIGFSGNGTSRLAKASTENAGQSIAVILDLEVIEAPIIREPIPNGAMLLSGGLTLQRAKDLAKLLRFGTLSALTIVERDIVQPR
ncbi:MAG: SecDF P1 head subdomain-containing protein [Pseudorhodoplanes sp.]